MRRATKTWDAPSACPGEAGRDRVATRSDADAYLGRMRVVLVGDSHLTETSPRRAVSKLPPRLRRFGLDVVSVAVGGANSRDALHPPIPEDSDWAIYSVGVNDAARWKSVCLEEFKANCDRILSVSGARQQLVLGPGPVIERHENPLEANTIQQVYQDARHWLNEQAIQ